MEGPIRGGAAIDGVRCFEEHVALDVFVRSPIGEGVGAGSGGSLENIDRLLAHGAPGTPACGVLVTDTWILTSNRRDWLDVTRPALVGAVSPVTPLASQCHYLFREHPYRP